MRLDRHFTLCLLVLLAVPLVAMALLPLADTTEPRYAEIARIMAQSGDWITPWYAPGVPFWGKPPLSFWAQAASLKWLGLSDFAPRFPSWLATVATLWLLYRLVSVLFDQVTAKRTVLIYASTALVFIASGAVMTDPYLTLGTTLSMAGVVMAGHSRHLFWRYAFFLGLAVGLLSKGPLALVLVGGSLFLWFVLHASARSQVKALPWVTGLLLTAVLVLPWYIAAELKTPGFLDYFVVGEHVRRFLDPGWAGDLYGTAHKAPYGTIWYYGLQAAFPWGLFGLIMLLVNLLTPAGRQNLMGRLRDERIVFLLGWMLFTPAFFTVSGNVLWTYVLPALPGLSVLVALSMRSGKKDSGRAWQKSLALVLIAPITIIALVALVSADPQRLKTEKWLVRYVQSHSEPDQTLYYLDDLPFSARFYSKESAVKLTSAQLASRLAQGGTFWLAVPKDYLPIPALEGVASHAFNSRHFELMRVTLPGNAQAMSNTKSSPDNKSLFIQ